MPLDTSNLEKITTSSASHTSSQKPISSRPDHNTDGGDIFTVPIASARPSDRQPNRQRQRATSLSPSSRSPPSVESSYDSSPSYYNRLAATHSGASSINTSPEDQGGSAVPNNKLPSSHALPLTGGQRYEQPVQVHHIQDRSRALPSTTTGLAHLPLRMSTATEMASHSVYSYASSSSAMPSASPSHLHHHHPQQGLTSSRTQEGDHVMRSPTRDRASKSRRASSGGSRIPERSAGHSGDEDTPMDHVASSSTRSRQQHQQGGYFAASDEAQSSARRQASRSPIVLQHSQGQQQPVASSSILRSAADPSTGPYQESSMAGTAMSEAASFSSSAVPPGLPPPAAAAPSSSSSGRRPSRTTPHLDLATYPPQQLLKILAALLHQIASSNDRFRPAQGQEERERKRNARRAGLSGSTDGGDIPSSKSSTTVTPMELSTPGVRSRQSSITTASMGALGTPSSTLCFHARNIPSISIESYLLRILKYCPTTNDVFLSLLVYFDRMSRMGQGAEPGSNSDAPAGESSAAGGQRDGDAATNGVTSRRSSIADQDGTIPSNFEDDSHPGMRGFVIDSYNVHRLVIAGVTVASKFFSDVFYTNSRYAKVGGLPVHELNQLELQFLLLNDFRLVIPLAELQRYADQLLAYGSGQSDTASIPPTVSTATGEAMSRTSSKTEAQEGVNEAEQNGLHPDRSAAAVVSSRRRASEADVVGEGSMAMQER